MKVILIGYGKMGKNIYNALRRSPKVTELTVCDAAFEKGYTEDGVTYINDLSSVKAEDLDCAFIATPATTHCQILKKLIGMGFKKIFVEKPDVVNQAECEEIKAIAGDTAIVCGYILRQSEPVFALKHILNKTLNEGYWLELCSVTYQKYLPVSAEARAVGDIGVYEEIVHIWDFLFNYLEYSRGGVELVSAINEDDPEKEGRVIYAQLTYLMNFGDRESLLIINSSFRAKDRKREMFFTLKNEEGIRRNVVLSFDNEDQMDYLTMSTCEGKVLYREEYPSLLKLDHQVQEIFEFFETGETGELALFGSGSDTVLDCLKKVGIEL